MSRYTAVPLTLDQGWGVYDTSLNHVIFASNPPMLESAAHIIEFALNAIAESRHLVSYPDHEGVMDWNDYEGPTDL